MVSLPKFIEDIIIGLILSDAHLDLQNKKGNGQARLYFKQSISRLNYVLTLFNLLSHYCKSYPVLKRGKFPYVYFSSRSLACFTELHKLFYDKNIKIIPLEIYDMLSMSSLAHWIMGDGSYVKKGGGIYLNTQSFSIRDNVRLMNVLIIKFNCKCTLHMQRGLPTIYIYSKSVKKLTPLLLPFMVPSMYYKLGI